MEPTCDATVRPTEKSGSYPLKIHGVDRVAARPFVDGKREVRGLPHSRVLELRDLGYEVEVTSGDDPERLAKATVAEAAAKAAADAPADAAEVVTKEPTEPARSRKGRS